MSAHNLIFGTPYLDIGDTASVTRILNAKGQRDGELKFQIEFTRRGWFNQEQNSFKCTGEAFVCDVPQQISVEGYWNRELTVKGLSEFRRVVWKKDPMPPNHQLNYFMSRFALQMNYLTDELACKIPPTDSRKRPDQSALEHGDFELAATQKHLLE